MSIDRSNIQSVGKCFSILELFGRNVEELRVKDISDKLEMPASSVHRALTTLEELGYIEQNLLTGKYRLGVKAFILGSNVNHINKLVATSLPYLAQLATKYKCVSHIAVEQNGKVLCVEKFGDYKKRNTIVPYKGQHHYIQVTSLGKVILAYLPQVKQKAIIERHIIFKKFTDYTITTRESLYKELHVIKNQGYSIDYQESELGLFCFGAPIFNPPGHVVSAISVSMYDPPHDLDKNQVIVDITKIAREISDQLSETY